MKKLRLLFSMLLLFSIVGCDFFTEPIKKDMQNKMKEMQKTAETYDNLSVLRIRNGSSKVVSDVSYKDGIVEYESGQLSNTLCPGKTCVVTVPDNCKDSICFMVGGKRFTTKDVYEIYLGNVELVVLDDYTLVTDSNGYTMYLGDVSGGNYNPTSQNPSNSNINTAVIIFDDDITCYRDDVSQAVIYSGDQVYVGDSLIFEAHPSSELGFGVGEDVIYWTIRNKKIDNESKIYRYVVDDRHCIQYGKHDLAVKISYVPTCTALSVYGREVPILFDDENIECFRHFSEGIGSLKPVKNGNRVNIGTQLVFSAKRNYVRSCKVGKTSFDYHSEVFL